MARPGLVVMRGPAWSWGDQDGGEGCTGELVARGEEGSGGGWWSVLWHASGEEDVYRVGGEDGATFDLRVAEGGGMWPRSARG
ncbi:hypothetical protein HYH03_008053 [Edaphochlamys debaryana]|uniref:MIB/HERC2 domain-containing protein n=1 Tax=Edaphochlamys debaryana TaxID=47281 RepID=A0A835Y485_9CHLO|nr:hypothetical protein HYH03_008053 [Edaphochlamys debaryana]|eukprot:KAG2493836.1 hypothetical protein HYH03_008053 [Edaphochlamys debaryana]